MFYTPEILCMRKKGSLARVWLAATLSERLFRQSVSTKVLLSIKIDVVCNEILRTVAPRDQQKIMRFSLYLSAQLMYGTVKLYSYQITNFQAFLIKIQHELRPLNFSKTKKRKRTSSGNDDIAVAIDLPKLPPLNEAFRNIHLIDDVNLLPEVDVETVREARTRVYVESPTFGELTEEQIDLFLADDRSWLQSLNEQHFPDLNEPIRYAAEDRNQPPLSPPPPIEQQDLGITIEDSTKAEQENETYKTPKKRESATTNADTPTKRRRRNLSAELEAAVKPISSNEPTIPPIDFPANDETNAEQPTEDASSDLRPLDAPPNDTNVTSANPHPVDVSVPKDSDLRLESLQPEIMASRPVIRNRRHRRIAIDEVTMIDQEQFSRLIVHTLAHTIIKEASLAVPARKRIVQASVLLKIPAKYHRTIAENRFRDGTRHDRWATELENAFVLRTKGPFTAEDENSMAAEAVRAADSRLQQMPQEISSGMGRAMGLESTGNKTTDEPSAETSNPTAITANPPPENNDEISTTGHVEFSDITNEPIFNNTGIADTASIVPTDVNAAPAETNVTTTSDPDTGDIDAFLPPKLRIRDFAKKVKHSKSPIASEAIVDIPDSPVESISSRGSLHSDWTKPELLAELAVHWARCKGTRETVKFALLAPPGTTRLNAATCFTLLLELHKDRNLNLVQEETYGDIYIIEAVGSR